MITLWVMPSLEGKWKDKIECLMICLLLDSMYLIPLLF